MELSQPNYFIKAPLIDLALQKFANFAIFISGLIKRVLCKSEFFLQDFTFGKVYVVEFGRELIFSKLDNHFLVNY